MRQRLVIFAFLLTVPIIGFLVSQGVLRYMDSNVRSALHQRHPEASDAQLQAVTVHQLCQDPATASTDVCQTDNNLTMLSAGSLAAGAAGVVLVLSIAAAGALSRNSRRLLLALFRPGLYLSLLVLVCLVVAHAAIAIAAIYYGESAIANTVHTGIILAIALGALAGVLAIGRGALSVVKRARVAVIGRMVSRSEAPELWQKIDAVADKLGALKPQHIVAGLDPNFFVTEAVVSCLSGTLNGRTLYFSVPLSRILTDNEFLAVVGHELGHFRGADTKFSERFYPIYRGTATSLAHLAALGNRGAGTLALLPAVAILNYFLQSFAIAERRLGRDRELLADKAGAEATSGIDIATALVKVHAFSGVWGEFQQAAAAVLRQGKAYINASTLFAEACSQHATTTALEGIAGTHLNHPTDTHPPLADRLKALGFSLEQTEKGALTVMLTDSAVKCIPNIQQIEEELTTSYQTILARQLNITAAAAPETPVEQPA